MDAYSLEQAIDYQPLTVAPTTPLLKAIEQLHQASLESPSTSCVLVTSGRQLLGTLSERDVVRLVATGSRLDGVAIAEVMARPIVVTLDQLQQGQAVSLLHQHQVNCLPILDSDHQLVGVLCGDRLRRLPPTVLSSVTDQNQRQVEQAIYQQTEEALQENQRMLWTLISNLPGMVYRCLNDQHWTIQLVSEGCFALTGFRPEMLVNNQEISYAQIIHPDDRRAVCDDVQTALANKQPFQLLYRITTALGVEKWVWEQGCGVFAEDGTLQAIEGFIFDMTERERAHQEREQVKAALQKSEDTNRALIAAIPDLLVHMSRDGTYLDFLPTKDFKVIMPDPHMQGKSVFEVMPLDFAQQRMQYIEQALETGKTQIYEYELTIDGQLTYEEARVVVSSQDEALVIVRDISDRKRAELALRDSEQLLRTVVCNTPTILYALDRDGKFTLSEGKGLEAIGLEPGQMVGRSVFEQYADYPVIVQSLRQVLAGEEREWVAEVNGYVFQNCGTALKNDQGQVIGAIGVATDITQWVRAEAALQQTKAELELRVQQRTAELQQINQQLQQEIAERRQIEAMTALLAQALENAGDAVQISNAEGGLEYTNHACEVMMGYSREEMHGKMPAMLFRSGEHSLEYYQAIEATIAAGQVWRGTIISQRKDGSLCHQETTISPVKDAAGKIVHHIAVKRDVTERLRVEESLRQSEARLRRVVDSNMLGIFFSDQSGKITEANDAFLALVGYTRQDLRAGKMNWHQMTPPEHQLINQRAADELQMFGVTQTYEKEYIRKDGSRVPALVGIALMEGDTQQAYDVTFVLDITNRKRVEEQLKASLEEKELLLREVHHRVKNNLQVISSIFSLQSQSLEDSNARSILAESQDRIRSIALIHEKLYQRDSFAQVDLADYIQSLTSDLFASYNISPNRIQLHLDVSKLSLPLDTAIPCGLLLNELISNSLKHAFLPQQPGEIYLRLCPNSQNQMELMVQDNGIGLPKHLDSERTNSLGLRLVRALTRQLEGTLEISSNKGACFQITFPLPKERRRSSAFSS